MLIPPCSHGLHSGLRFQLHQLVAARGPLKRPPTLVSPLPYTRTQCRVLLTGTQRTIFPPDTRNRPSPLLSLSPPRNRDLLQASLAAMASADQTRASSGHHHHHHHGDNLYLTSTNKDDAGVRITLLGLYVNIGMAIVKGVGGYVFHSHCMPSSRVMQALQDVHKVQMNSS